MYIKGPGDGGTFTVMLNADGTPKIWWGEEWKKVDEFREFDV